MLFVDIVASTEQRRPAWRPALARVARGATTSWRAESWTRFRGREIDTAGDGLFAAFDGPARAVRCAEAITTRVRALGIEVRAGLHTGECEVIGEKVGGIAVHIGARVAALAQSW